jgi:hypothetical protein
VLRVLDWVCTAGVWATGVMTVYFKLQGDCAGRPKLAYIVQPCHLSNFILCALTFMRATPRAAWLFEFYLVTAFGALCALATPDTRGLDLLPFGCEGLLDARAWEGHTWEKVSFFVQHVLLVVLPALWIARRRFALAPPPTVDGYSCLTMWALLSVVHWDVFAPLSYLTGHNVNYMLVPPGGPLFLFGRYYRLVMLLACLPFAFIMRLRAYPLPGGAGRAVCGGEGGAASAVHATQSLHSHAHAHAHAGTRLLVWQQCLTLWFA